MSRAWLGETRGRVVALFNTALNHRHPLSPTRGLVGFTFFWTVTAFTAVTAVVGALAYLAPRLGL